MVRTKDITPLEHAHKHFETGEIENQVLEKIVELFYITRYASVEITKSHGYSFIEYLDNLVLGKEQIAEKLQNIEKEIKENLTKLE